MHGLHLIKFLDRGPSWSSKVAQEHNSETVRQHCNQTEKLVSQIFTPQLHTKIESNKPTKRPSVQKCISQIFGQPNYDISKRKISKRFHSFLLRKRKVLSNSSFVTDGKGKHIKNKEKSKTRRKKCLPRSGSVSDKIEVLFKSKHWKSKRRRPLTLNSKDICKYAIHYNSKSSYDLNDRKINRNNKFCCQLHIPHVKRRRSKPLQTAVASCDNKRYRHFYSDHTIQNTKDNLKNSTCHHHAHQLGPTYNVIDFPNAASFVPNDFYKCKPETRQFDNQRMAVVTSFENSKGGGDNAASVPVQETFSLPIFHPKNHLKSRPRSHSVFPKYKNSRASKVPACPIFITKSIKFTLFSLSVIIWFPCILVMSLLWIISNYPMRPHELIKTVRDIENCKTELCQNDGQDYWQSIYTCIAGAVKKLLRLYEAMFSLIKNSNGKRNFTRLVTSRSTLLCRNGDKQYPNPRKKYKLFYDNDRGWVMKPIKLRKEKGFEKTIKTCREAIPEDTFKKKGPTTNLTEYNKEVFKVESPSKCLIKDLQVTKKESHDLYIQESERMKYTHRKNSRNRQNNNNKAEVSDCLCDQMKKTTAKHVNCVCESVQTDYQPNYKSKNIPVYSSLQKSPKFVTFDDRIQPHLDSHVLENICPINLRKCCSLKSSCLHHNERNVKMNEIKVPSLPVIQRRCLCNCKFNKPIDGLNRKYAVPCKLRNQHRSRFRQSKGQKKDKKQKPRPKRINKFLQFFRKFRKKAAIIIKEADSKVWNCDNCEDTFVQTLRKRPWAWVHRRWPKFYPYFLIFCKFYENIAYAMLYACTACIWCPVFCWCYFCCNLFCRCVL